jgi:hypothetical protein
MVNGELRSRLRPPISAAAFKTREPVDNTPPLAAIYASNRKASAFLPRKLH